MPSEERNGQDTPADVDNDNSVNRANVDDEHGDVDVDPYERVQDDDYQPQKRVNDHESVNSSSSFAAAFFATDDELVAPAVILPWQIALFLFTSSLVQNFSYCMTGFLSIYTTDWTDGERNQFTQLVYNMLYLGPIFGLMVDLTRVFRERYRPVIILASAVNAALCFICFGVPTLSAHYGRSLIIAWLSQIAVIFIYVPCNALVISYGNSMLQSADESSARIGGLMAQAMVARTFGTLIYQFVYTFAGPRISTQPDRWMLLIAAIGSCFLIVQIILPFTMKRSYFVDRREISFKYSAPVRFYFSIIRARRNAVSRRRKATNTTFMFILCFVFIYFMLPDTLYNTLYSFNSLYTPSFSVGLNQAISILSSLGALLGALAYALWMYFAHEYERKHHRLCKTNPFQIVLAGCAAWALGSFVHFIGAACYDAKHFSYKVFIPFQAILVQMFLRFAFMPTLSLVAMHSPRGYETTAFELFSVDTSGGGLISYPITDYLMKSMGVTDYSGMTKWGKYWQVALICIFFQFLPLLIALSLPKHRDEEELEALPREVSEREPLRGNEEEMEEANSKGR